MITITPFIHSVSTSVITESCPLKRNTCNYTVTTWIAQKLQGSLPPPFNVAKYPANWSVLNLFIHSKCDFNSDALNSDYSGTSILSDTLTTGKIVKNMPRICQEYASWDFTATCFLTYILKKFHKFVVQKFPYMVKCGQELVWGVFTATTYKWTWTSLTVRKTRRVYANKLFITRSENVVSRENSLSQRSYRLKTLHSRRAL